MSRSLVLALLAADVVAVALVTAWLVRWYRSGAGAGSAAAPKQAASPVSATSPVSAGSPAAPVAVVARPTLTVLPTVPFVPPPRASRQRAAFGTVMGQSA